VEIKDIVDAGPVIPVIVLNEMSHAVPLARALIAGGIRVLEVTLRTPIALDAVQDIRQKVPEAIVGVGTITTPRDFQLAVDAGAHFGVSPASSMWLLDAAKEFRLPFLPGTLTPSEVLAARDAGFHEMKLFPALEAGGPGFVRALGAVYPDVRFCPTGGIIPSSAREYLALPNVCCVGGSWLTPKVLIEAGDWAGIEQLARDASTMRVGLGPPETRSAVRF